VSARAIPEFVCYPNLLSFETTPGNVDAFMHSVAAAGVRHVQVNHLPDLMHPEQLSQPGNVYLWFANFGPPLDLFFSSNLNRGLYPEMYLERNRRTLLRFVESARRHGIQPMLYLCEPRFVPERFFERHPTLRGPRVDNPTCSTKPLFALCTDLPEVREHYRQMMAQAMGLAPDLSMATIFTSDSGSGFDYNPHTYAGPNGAGFNQKFPLEKRVERFLSLLCDAARQVNPQFTVNLSSGFSEQTRARIFAIAPQGVVGSVYGLYDWAGGLEEHWGYHQALWGEPKAKWNVLTLDRTKAAEDRFADMQARFELASRGGKNPIVHAELPTTDYPRPVRYTPHPFETVRLMKDLHRLGAKRVALWGVISSSELVPQDVNLAAMQAANENINADAATLITQIARQWVGEKHAAALVEAWRLCDQAWTRRPLWNHVGLPKQALPGPLVPDLLALKPQETAYYRTIALDELEQIQGCGSFIRHEPDERVRDYVVHELYEKQTLHGLLQAVQLLDHAASGAAAPVAESLQRQRDHIHVAYLMQRSHYNWYDAGRYLVPGDQPRPVRSMTQIVDDEIDHTLQMIQLLDGRQNQFIRTMNSDQMTYEFGPSFTSHLKCRVEVMRRHRNDPVRNLNGQLGKFQAYLKAMET
jgi:hypothetical protein